MTIYAVCYRVNGKDAEMVLSLHKEKESAESMLARFHEETSNEHKSFYYVKERWLSC